MDDIIILGGYSLEMITLNNGNLVLMMTIDGTQGTIYDETWTEKEATVVCKQLNSANTHGIAKYAKYDRGDTG